MRTNLIVVDNFYQNVDDVRKFALSQDFSVEDDSIEQIGVSTDKNIGALLNTINKIIMENK